jgi:hypothetical protein
MKFLKSVHTAHANNEVSTLVETSNSFAQLMASTPFQLSDSAQQMIAYVLAMSPEANLDDSTQG